MCVSSVPPIKIWARMVAAGRFRQDLFYRLNVIQLRVPPLRERFEDVSLISDKVLGTHRRGRRRVTCTASDGGCADACCSATLSLAMFASWRISCIALWPVGR